MAECLARLRATHDVVVIEGAGSPAEINLRDADLVNMHVARLAEAPVLLVGDIDRGGVFASSRRHAGAAAARPTARGWPGSSSTGCVAMRRSSDPGLAELHALTGVPVLGVVPWIAERLVPSEDSLDLTPDAGDDAAVVDIAVVRLPRLANFDDFEWLAAEPGVRVRWVTSAGRARMAPI